MRYTILVLVLLLVSTLMSVAQNTYSVKGIIADTASNAQLENASISILNQKDSTLVTFTRAAANGTFAISKLPKGLFILLVTYPEYADYVENFKIDSAKSEMNFGQINMSLKANLLAEVIVKARVAAIKINGDTTEFNAAAYVIQPDSKVEDLLKQLPGIQIDKDGKITAQGEKVNKVLLDGEEFFGDDPTLVTKNIRADMVDKVQLYDKKSDQAAFTGIEDGVKNKTINIKLKEDKKNGTFGKVDAGIGTKKFYQGQAIYNTFKSRQKMSAYGTIGNTGKTGLGWEDENKVASSNDDDNMMYMYGQNWDDMTYFGEGIPLARTGGLHYDNKWNNDKHAINGNYKVGSLAIDGSKNSITQNNLPSSILNNTSNQVFHNFVFRQKFDGVYQLKIDTTSNLKLSFDATFKNSDNFNSNFAEGRRNFDTLLNRSATDVLSKANQRIFNASAFYTKKLKKKGRTLSVRLSQSFNERNEKDSLKSNIEFYDPTGQLDSTQINDQFRKNDVNYTSVNSNITYTEPLTGKLSLVLNYGLNVNNSASDRRTFNQSTVNVYNAQVDSLSSNYKLNQLSNRGGLTFNYKGDKSSINFGTNAASVNFNQKDLFTGANFSRQFINWFPQASLYYKFSQRKSLYINYYGSTNQPSIQQIQPVRTGNDFLNLTLGNPDLRPSFRNGFSAYYSSYKVLSEMYFMVRGNYSYTINPIVSNVTTDATTGRSVYQSFNLPGKNPNDFSVYSSIQKKIKKLDLNVDLNLSASGNTYYNLVDNQLNKSNANNYSARIGFSQYKAKKYDFYGSFGPYYATGQSSLQKDRNNNGKGYNASGNINLYLPFKFQLQTDFNYNFQAKTQSFDTDFHQSLWNATITKKFLKQDNLRLSLAGYDLLNQKTGFSRNTYNNSISQTTATTIRRLFLFSVVYEFNKMGGAKKE